MTRHGEASGKSVEYFDDVSKERYTPHAIEPSIGVDRLMLAVLCSAYKEDEVRVLPPVCACVRVFPRVCGIAVQSLSCVLQVGGEKRSFLQFHPTIAPVKAAVLPLVKNNLELVAKAREVFERLQRRYNVMYDASGECACNPPSQALC